ncbi:MAG TPA: ABC transporter permease [Candidatus Dormibacteraeota bacterium]|nr:ABC transporter permease [Candidatus Dormibacteraeota bacterium]
MNRVAVALWNPIVAKEYRSRMRTWRSPVAMTVYILLLGGLGWAIFSSMAASARSGFNTGQAANYGQGLFLYLVLFQMVLLAFITPALTAGAVSSERERQTIDLLFVTKLPSFSILWGKLLASMSFVLLLLLLSVPIFSLVFLFGGIELDQVLAAFLVTAVAALTLGIVGIACSSAFRRTLPATVCAYGAAFVLLAGSLLFGLLFPTDLSPNATTAPAPPAVTYLSPLLPLITIGTNGPITGYGVRNGNGIGFAQGGGMACSSGPNGVQSCYAIGGNGAPIGKGFVGQPYNPPQASGTTIPSGLFSGWQYWQATVTLQLVICVAALILSALLLPPIRHLPWRRRARARTAG